MLSLADLEQLYYGGGSDAKRAFLESAAAAGVNAPDLLTVAQLGNELGYAELVSQFQTTAGGGADITGLAVTFTAPERPIELEFFVPLWSHSIASGKALFYIFQNGVGGTEVGRSRVQGDAVAAGNLSAFIRTRLPNSGFAITPGQQYTFQASASLVTAGTLTVGAAVAGSRAHLRAVMV